MDKASGFNEPSIEANCTLEMLEFEIGGGIVLYLPVIFATEDIPANTELTWHYGLTFKRVGYTVGKRAHCKLDDVQRYEALNNLCIESGVPLEQLLWTYGGMPLGEESERTDEDGMFVRALILQNNNAVYAIAHRVHGGEDGGGGVVEAEVEGGADAELESGVEDEDEDPVVEAINT